MKIVVRLLVFCLVLFFLFTTWHKPIFAQWAEPPPAGASGGLSYPGGCCEPLKAFDGSTATFWAGDPASNIGGGQWRLYYDYGSTKSAGSIVTINYFDPYYPGSASLYVSSNGTSWTLVNSIPNQPTTSFTVSQTFRYLRVIFLAGSATPPYIREITVSPPPTPTPCAVPPPPSGLSPSGTINGVGAKTFSWNSVSGATSYAIRFDDTATLWCDPPLSECYSASYPNCTKYAGDYCNDSLGTNSTTYTVQAGRTYRWWVSAINSCGWSASSLTTVTVTAPTATPIPPTATPLPTATPIAPTATPTPIPASSVVNWGLAFVKTWFQTQGGNIFSQGALSPVAIPTPPPLAGSYFSNEGASSPQKSPGIVACAVSGGCTSYGGGLVSNMGWKADGVALNPVNYDYAYYFARFKFTPATCPVKSTITVSDGVSCQSGDATVTAPLTVSSPTKSVILINGNLTVGQKITVNTGGFVSFIVSGDIHFANTLGSTPPVSTPSVQGLYIASKKIIVDSKNDPPTELQFIGQGVFVGYGGIDLNRNIGTNNANYPAEVFNYDPDLVRAARTSILRTPLLWQQVPP